MPYVYSNSYLTLSAAASRTPHGGIIRAFENVYEAILEESIVLRLKRYSSIPEDFTQSRAWCLQEQRLSRQLLKFITPSIWSKDPQEIVNRYGPFSTGQQFTDFYSSNDLLTVERDYSHSGSQQVVAQWRNILKIYTQRDLTHSTNKLPAISGVARHITARNPADRYLAGIFLSHRPQFLLWQTAPQTRASSAGYQASSWS
jgi:hypothetical protein